MRARAISVVLTVIGLAGCAANVPAPMPPPEPAPAPAPAPLEPGYVRVGLMYGTDRNLNPSPLGAYDTYGEERGELTYGIASVTVPESHEIGKLEQPLFGRLFENPEDHIVLHTAQPVSDEEFFRIIRTERVYTTEHDALVFIHGYQNTFEDAARRTAQLVYDLEFKGTPIFYSWPSKGRFAAYTVDDATIEWSKAYVKEFFERLLEETYIDRFFLVAHSMGNRALLSSISEILRENPAYKDRVKEIILAAPDVDAQAFKRDILPVFRELNKPVTLYASSNDLALKTSEVVNGVPRLGLSGGTLFVESGVETIDASRVDTGLIGHAYYGDSESLISDIYELITYGTRPDGRRPIREARQGALTYWEFRRDP